MNKVYFIKGISNDPYFNLASEEYLLKHRQDFFVYLWINSPSVIVGVNQVAAQEVNFNFTEERGIKVVRRQTGGGAVYHDLNNVCYTVIAEYDGGRDNYRFFSQSIIDYLASLGVNAEFTGRNDLTIDGKKFSGNAQCVHKGRIMHHGTLLFNTDTSVLDGALKPHKFKLESKGIRSNRARVTNIAEHLPVSMTCEQFFEGLSSYLKRGMEEYAFTDGDIKEINELVKNKYATFEWNVGRSPKADIESELKLPFGYIKVYFSIESGRLTDVNFTGDFFSLKEISGLNHALNGTLYSKQDVLMALCGVEEYISGSTPDQIIQLFFK